MKTAASPSRPNHSNGIDEGEQAPDVVFASREGTMRDEANLRHVFYRILDRAKLRHIRFHDLRHTYASLLIQQRESLAYVKEQMGHSSIQVPVDVYDTWCPAATARRSIGSTPRSSQTQPPRNQSRSPSMIRVP